jgi:hypothetical protein
MLTDSHTDKHYSRAERQGAAAHKDPRTYTHNYRPRQSGVDGQGTFLGNERRDIVSEAFLELTIPHNPNLSLRFPAEEKYTLESGEEYRDLEEEIAMLGGKKDTASKSQSDKLYRKTRPLRSGGKNSPTGLAVR